VAVMAQISTGQERKNDTRASTTDPDSRLHRRRTGGRQSCRIWAMSR
jgi:hypothetical protein